MRSVVRCHRADPVDPYSARAFCWRPPAPPQFLDSAPLYATAVSADGSVIVGNSPPEPAVPNDGFRWTSGAGFQTLPHHLPPTNRSTYVQEVSADGRVVLVRYSDRKPRLFVEPGTALKLLREIGFGTAKVNMAGWQPDQQQADV